MKRIVFLFLTLIAGGLFASNIYAAPIINSVSGSLDHNRSVTISGSGFGSKPQAAPFLWDTVDNIAAYGGIANGQAIPVGSGYPWVANRQMVMNLTEGRGGSKAYKGINTIKGGLDGRALGESPSHLYVSWWWKPSANPNLPFGGHSSKFLRLSNSANLVNKTFSWTQMQSYVYDNPNYLANIWADYPGTVNQWNFHEVWFDNNSRRFTVRVNGSALINNASWSGGSGFNMNMLWGIGWDGGGASPPALTTWMDDIYYDGTLSRVMIGNASTYERSTRLEMQIPLSWSPTGINISVNIGGFENNQQAYLYVFDENGNVNANGYPIIIGGGGDSPLPPAPAPAPVPAPAPAPPTGVRILN